MLTYIHSILQTHNSVSTQFERLIQQILEINELNTLLKDRSPATERIGPVKLCNKFKEMLYLSLDGCRRHVTFLIHDDEGSSKRQTYVSLPALVRHKLFTNDDVIFSIFLVKI